MEMEYDLTLAQEAYGLATRWDASRDREVPDLDFRQNDIEAFDTNQKGDIFNLV